MTYEEMMMQIAIGSLYRTDLAPIIRATSDIRILKYGLKLDYPFSVSRNKHCPFNLFILARLPLGYPYIEVIKSFSYEDVVVIK